MFLSRNGIKTLILTSLFAVLTYIGALIQIPMYLAPITLQTFFVMLSGLLLGSKYGVFSQLLYIFLGLVGLPVFAGGGGIGYVLSPTFGFIIGFIPLAYFSGFAHGNKFRIISFLLIGNLILYCLGTTYIWFIVNNVVGRDLGYITILKGMVIYLPGDFLKVIIAIPLALKIKNRLKMALFSS